jgi:hypothetical protein
MDAAAQTGPLDRRAALRLVHEPPAEQLAVEGVGLGKVADAELEPPQLAGHALSPAAESGR